MSDSELPSEWDDDFKEALKVHSLPEAYALKVHYEAGDQRDKDDEGYCQVDGC